MPKLEYWSPVFMMCDLKLNILSFMLGIFKYGPFLSSLSHEAQCTSLIGKGGWQKGKNTSICCLLFNLLLPLLKVRLNSVHWY